MNTDLFLELTFAEAAKTTANRLDPPEPPDLTRFDRLADALPYHERTNR